MAVTIENVESRTLLEQFHSLYKNQQETDEKVTEIDTNLADEIQNRTDADYELSQDIAGLQAQLDSLGNVFTLKGSVATVNDLPETNNNIGDVYYVESVSSGYVWIDDNGTERWEQLGLTVDLSNYVTNDELTTELAGKQNKLTAGTNISIIGDTISATQPDTSKYDVLTGLTAPTTSTVGAVGQMYIDTVKNDTYQCVAVTDLGSDTYSYTWELLGGAGKQNKLTAGTNITITGDVISASGGDANAVTLDTTTQTFSGNKTLNISQLNLTTGIYNLRFMGNPFIRMIYSNNIFTDINYDNIVYRFNGTHTLSFPTKTGTLALTSDIPLLYKHTLSVEDSASNPHTLVIISTDETPYTDLSNTGIDETRIIHAWYNDATDERENVAKINTFSHAYYDTVYNIINSTHTDLSTVISDSVSQL